MNSTLLIEHNAWTKLPSQWRTQWTDAAILGDETVMALFADRLKAILAPLGVSILTMSFPCGENHKTRVEKERLEDILLEHRFPRHGVLLGLGGGISTDLTGFVASTYLRGLDCVLLPTSLLAQVDAAIGGKTGVNTPHGKNLIGTFHPPKLILIDPLLPQSLPAEEIRNGLAEMVKTAVLTDESLFDALERHAQENGSGLPSADLVARCARIKDGIVRQDAREQGLRAVLNFGHSIGHALEAHSSYRLRHGEAIALGMVVEGRLSMQRTGFPIEHQARLEALLGKFELRRPFPATLPQLWPYLLADKKNRSRSLRMALPKRIGLMEAGDGSYTVEVSYQELESVFPTLNEDVTFR